MCSAARFRGSCRLGASRPARPGRDDARAGRPVTEVLPGWQQAGPLVPVATMPGPDGLPPGTLPFEPGGREMWLSISGVAFPDGDVYAFRNVTEERALDELKGEFVATISHELRTPLAAIYGSAQTLRRDDLELDHQTRGRLLEVITTESERLTRIASEILLANSLDSGRLKLDSREVDLYALAGEVVEEMRAIFADRDGLEISLP